MRTSYTTEESKYMELFDNFINGNLSDFRHGILKLSKVQLLDCIDLLIQTYGYEYQGRDIVRIFIYHLKFKE